MSNFAPQSVSRSRYVPLMGAVLFAVFALALAIHPWRSVQAVGSSTVVISQVYGGGGNAGSTYKNDFIELFNRGNSAVSLSGWSVQYASAAGTSWQVTNLTSVSLAPGQYYLVQEAAQGAGTTNLPTADATGSGGGIPMSATAGKVALLNSTTALATSGCPFSANVIDFVGFGSGTSCSEGTATAAPSNTTAVIRAGGGCTDTDSNSANFAVGAPIPRNTSSALNPCGGTNQPIAPTCPASVTTNQGTSAFASVSATDSDGRVTGAIVTSTPVPGITLDSFTSAATVGGTATATLNVANTTAPGTYPVVIQYSNNDSTPQTASCTVTVTVIATPNQSTVAISQVYGGGGNAGAPFTNDFIEIINRTGSPVSLNGWSVQYASTTGTSWQVTPLTNVSLQPGQYYLVQESSGGAVGANLPTPDTTDTISIAATAGKVALVNSTTALTSGCPLGGSVIDFVGFGTGSTCFEGAGTTATLSNTTAALRANAGCTDTNSNSADFSAGAPNPRNTSSPANPCVAINQAIVPTCPGSLSTNQGTAASANVSATDVDGRVTSAAITSAAVAGITLDGFTPAGAVGGTATATLNVANTTATGTYNVTIQYSNNDSPTPQTASCTVLLTVNTPPAPFNAAVKISQVYGGGGNSGSTYVNDFIELYNTGATPVDITGWSVQYTGATTAFAAQTTPTPGDPPTPQTTTIPPGSIIQPGHYFLIQESQGAGGTTTNPAPDLTGGILVGSTAGKVALVASSNVLTGGTANNCPTDPLIVDFIGYGISPTTATCAETSPTITLTNNTAAIRKNNGCTDTNNNANDFLIDGPIPRNSSSPVHRCGGDPSQPSGVGIATPDYLLPSSNTLLTVNVSPATTPPSTGIAISANLTSIGGAASQQFYDDGTNGDVTAGDNIFSYLQTVGPFITTGVKNIVANITDAQARSATAPITITIQSPTCGVERWAVKTGGDPDAALVDLNPVPATIANLRTLTPPPSVGANTPRTAPGETTVYTIRATMKLYKLESDVDYHIVVQDENGATMVTEIPCPCCVAAGSPFTAGIANARHAFDARFTATTSFQSATVPVQITGVGFFDPIHGQTGVAPNGIELHPILDIRFLANTTTNLTSGISPSQYGNSVMFTSTVASSGPNVPTGNVTFKDGATVISSSALNASGQASFTTTSLSVGSHSITASYPGDNNSLASTSTVVTQVVNKADQFITFTALSDKTYGDAPFNLSATASSGLPVSFQILSGPATVSGTTVTITGAGSGAVRASQAGDGNYNAAPDFDESFTVLKANATVNVTGFSGAYDGNPHGATGSATGVHGEDLTSLLSLGASFTNVPGGTAHWTFAGNANYAPSSGDVAITINKASSTTTVTCSSSETYTGSAIEPCTATVTGVGGVNQSVTVLYTNNINAGAASATATYGGDANHDGSTGNGSFTITKASSTTTVNCPTSETYTGSAIEPCTATATGVGGLNQSVPVLYTNNINAGSASATATYGGDANHDGSTGNGSFTITKASSTTTVNCPTSETYTGSAIEPCTATVTGAGSLNQSVTVLYTNNVNAGSASASATYGGDANHDGSTGNGSFTITKAASTTTVNCPASATYTGSAIEPCTASYSGPGGLSGSLTPTYSNNTNVGTASASATYGGDANHEGSTGNGSFTITKAASTTTVNCPASATYTGSAIEPCTASYSGPGGLSGSLTPTYSNNTNVGTASASATYGGDANHEGSTGNGSFTITKASSTTAVNCPASAPYTGAAIEPCNATATGVGGLNQSVPVLYASNTNAGSASATATYGGDANHEGSAGNGSFTITKASSTTTVNCPASAPYTGAAIEPCNATVTGAGGLNQSVAVLYANNTNAGSASATATYGGDANHEGSTGNGSFTITKAASTTTVNCPASETYTGSAIEPCNATVTGAGGLNQSVAVLYANNTNAGSASATATYGGDANHDGSTGNGSFTITKAASTTTVNCPASETYTGSAIEPCTASYSGAGGLSGSLTPSYANNTNAGSASATATYGGDANHEGSAGNGSFTITKASSTTTVNCPASAPYTGAAIEPCNATATGVGGLNQSVPVLYANNTNAGSASATATYGGDANHDGSTGNGSFTITKAASTTTVNCPASETYTGSAIEPCTASYSGAGGLSGSLTPSYANNTDAGTASATATYGGDANHEGSSGNGSFTITQASSTTTVTCTGSPVYTGSPITPCSVTVTGANLSLTPAPVYSNNVNAGTNTASASYTFAGDANHTGSSDSKNFSIAKANATVSVSGYTGVYDGISHRASGTATGVNGEDLSTLLNLGASFTNVPGGTAHWTFNAGNTNGNYNSTAGDVSITITKATPSITWNNPADIVYGTALSSTQLNATASVAGSFNYTPASGTVLNVGSGQSLLANLTPTDTTNYNATSKNVQINVLKATPSFSNLSSPAIAYGTPSTNLSGKITFGSLIPTGSVAITLNGVTQNAAIQSGGNFSSSFATGSLAAGSYNITYSYAGDSNFNSASGSGTLTVGYGVVPLYDQTKVHHSGSTIPIKLNIVDANGNNISSANLVVTAVGVSLISTSVYGPVEDAGNANPDNDFRFSGGSYIFNLKTTGLTTGVYNLYFRVGADPTLHTVQFQIR
jgi:hypothetical protein